MFANHESESRLWNWGLDLDEVEREQYPSDAIYNDCLLYHFRNCDTCSQDRIPKSSHCGACGHCVIGWDHHCAALNNCVGRRNLRSFVYFLTFSFSFALAVFGNCLFLLLIGRDGYCPASLVQRLGIVVGCAIILLFIYVFTRFWKKRGLKQKLMAACAVLFLISTIATA